MARTKGSPTRSRPEPEGTTKIWSAIRFLKKFGLEDLELTTHQGYSQIRKYVGRLQRSGYLRLVQQSKGGKSANQYRLIRDTGPKAPIPRFNQSVVFDPNNRKEYAEEERTTLQQLMWDYITASSGFTTQDLEGLGVPRSSVLRFVGALTSSRYLKVLEAPKPGPGGALGRYCLKKKTGPLAPRVSRDGTLIDRNQ